jgi:hypothetical protein
MSNIISTNYKDPALSIDDVPWHSYEREEGCNELLANAVVATVQDIEKRQQSIYDGNKRHARLYCGYTPTGLNWGSGPALNQRAPFEATKNVARGVCDTATSLIVRNRPKSTFVTDGADFERMMQAEDMDSFMLGSYELSSIYQVAPRSFLDSTIFGTGAWKYVGRGTGAEYHIKCERMLIDDLIIDEDECREQLDPPNTYHRVLARADALVFKYASGDSPEDKDLRRKILASKGNTSWPNRNIPPNCVVVIDAIHYDPYVDNEPRHVICVQGAVLKDEPWPYDFQPYTILWWSMPVSGFYGDGVCYRQYGRQQRITYMYRWIQRVQDIFGTPRAWIDPSGGPPSLQLSNEIGAVITARKPPTFQVQSPVPPDTYKWLDELERGTWEDEGISFTSGQGQLPPGVDSAPAQREWSYKESQKFAPVSQRWEHAVAVDPATKMIAMYKRHIEMGGPPPNVRWADRSRMYSVSWPDLAADAYIIRAEASSLDSMSPAARIQSALELSQTGWINPSEGRALVSHPDLKQADDLDNSGETYAKWVALQMKRGKKVAVDEKMDLVALDRIIRQTRALMVTQNAPVALTDEMARYLEQLDMVKQNIASAQLPSAAPAMPVPGMAAGPGIGVPLQG